MSSFVAGWTGRKSATTGMWFGGRSRPEDRHAEFEALVAQDWDRFWRFAYRLTGSRDSAEDLLSESLIDAFASFDRYRGEHFDRWFFKMLVNNSIDMARKAKRRRAESLETAYSESAGRDIADSRPDPEAELMAPLYSEPVQKALDGLPEEFRTAVLLCDVEGFDYAEIAQILKVPIGTVRSRISRGRERLRGALTPPEGK